MAPEIQERAIVALNRYGHTLGTLGLEGPDGETRKGQNPLKTLVFLVVEPRGIDSLTSAMPGERMSISGPINAAACTGKCAENGHRTRWSDPISQPSNGFNCTQ